VIPLNKVITAALLMAIFPLPHDYYTFLRFAVPLLSLYLIYENWDQYSSIIKIGLVLVAWIFNPVDPIYLNKEQWVFIDLIIAGLMWFINDIDNKLSNAKSFDKFLSNKSTTISNISNASSDNVVIDLTEKIYEGAIDSANAIIVTNDEISKEHQMTITILLCQGLLQLIDRSAFTSIPNKRNNFIDELMISVAAKIVTSYSGEKITDEQKRTLLTTMIQKNNEVMQFLSQFKKLMHEDNEPAGGTLMWEFGSLFAEKIGHPKDILFVTIGMESIMNIFNSLNLKDVFKKIR